MQMDTTAMVMNSGGDENQVARTLEQRVRSLESENRALMMSKSQRMRCERVIP